MRLVHRIGVRGCICIRMGNHGIGIWRSVTVESGTHRRTEGYSIHGLIRIRWTVCKTGGSILGVASGVWDDITTKIGSNVASTDFALLDLK